uniref:Uncharacterized protein n=1 Tax=Pyxicephalus adspersus TaxID=30357 RepID=A0AAV2ZV45_PYXAD|nr:TPA: hypothetical protein GDO54_004697 [Pyxicephalus adspersus]
MEDQELLLSTISQPLLAFYCLLCPQCKFSFILSLAFMRTKRYRNFLNKPSGSNKYILHHIELSLLKAVNRTLWLRRTSLISYFFCTLLAHICILGFVTQLYHGI